MSQLSLAFLYTCMLCVPFLVCCIILLFMQETSDKTHLIKAIYIYVVSLGSLFVLLLGLGTIVYRSLQYNVFPKADDYNYGYEMCVSPKYVGTGEVMPNEGEIQACESRVDKDNLARKETDFQSSMLSGMVMIIIALPVYILHFFYLRKKL